MIALTTALCIVHVVVEFQEVAAAHSAKGEHPSNWHVTKMVLQQYWPSVAVAFVAILFSLFVVTLSGFHCYIVSLNLTT